jgi:hypothetical protein
MTEKPGAAKRCRDLEKICLRVREKFVSYDQYNFTGRYNDFLKAFFDLCQEFDSLEEFYRICVAVPLEMTGLECALYLYDDKTDVLHLVCDTARGVLARPEPAQLPVQIMNTAYDTETSYVVPIYSKSRSVSRDEDSPSVDSLSFEDVSGKHKIFGMFEVVGGEKLPHADRFFFRKYCNRIGYNLHNRLIANQNVAHLRFINNLVVDIEHNIIVPNMYFKHIFNQLKKKIMELNELKGLFRQLPWPENYVSEYKSCLSRCDDIYLEMLAYHQELVKHHANTSLFLESLFRREHFKKGHLVLRTRRCFVEKEIILPQLEHYAGRLRAANVRFERPRNMLEEEFEIFVDVGLLSQVYANLFSNAAKYAGEIVDHQGNPRKAVAYGRELIDNFPEEGKQGIKFNVFTTGENIDPEEAVKLFEEGVRGRGSEKHPGTGHGLAFIRHVIELHGGKVGCEATPEGNNFYFILPVPPPADQSEPEE